MLDEVQQWIDDSRYDNWELYFLITAGFLSICILAEIRFVTNLLRRLDTMVFSNGITLGEIVIAALQGIVVGLFGWKLFSQGDRYFKAVTSDFAGKETAFLTKIGVMTIVGIIIGVVIPKMVETHADYVVMQTGGLVILLGYGLIHLEIRNWRIIKELPVLLASGLLAFIPYFT